MSVARNLCLSLFSALILAACSQPKQDGSAYEALMPMAETILLKEGVFALEESITIGFEGFSLEASESFIEVIGDQALAQGFAIVKEETIKTDLSLSIEPNLEPEQYVLEIGTEGINIKAGAASGAYFGWQTLRQILLLQEGQPNANVLRAAEINDKPAYEYRSVMLDVARHFFEPEVVKQLIDQLTLYKVNTLHLHLSDDQGWRIEIKKWPNLTAHGGLTEVGGTDGGYFTQEQYNDLVAYAKSRFINVVPEIDLPGHTNAALSSYPELNCDGIAPELYTGIEVGFSTLCADKEITYTFLNDVFEELAAMTPGPYIHIGGDESHVTSEEDYVKLVDFALDKVKSLGKTPVGWDEIAHGAVDQTTVSQYWASQENTEKAYKKGAKLIISPAIHAYLDMKYDSLTPIGLKWAGYLSIDKAYDWSPDALVEGVSADQIIGTEALLWTETVTTVSDIQYLMFPRVLGIAEIAWSKKEKRSLASYKARLESHLKLLDRLQIGYYKGLK
jgi:hexosaminidase